MEDTLVLIPARGGSKGVPGKNIKPLNGKPLIYYSLDVAKKISEDKHICVSTDDLAIKKKVEEYGLEVPFLRPSEIAGDTASMDDVIRHALDFFKKEGRLYKKIVLLQPTSPFRKIDHLEKALQTFRFDQDMLVSVKVTDSNPYYVLMEENENGYLIKSKTLSSIVRRQDAPIVYELNGSIYVINIQSFIEKGGLGKLEKIKKIEMEALYSVDIDTPMDWAYCEFLIENGYFAS